MIHFVRSTSVHQPTFTCESSLVSHNSSQNDILGQTTYRTWWNHIAAFCPAFSGFHYSTLFQLHWPASTLFERLSLNSELPEIIGEHLVQHSHPPAHGILDPSCNCLARCGICSLPPVGFAVIVIIQVTIPGKRIFSVRNAARCTIHITFCCMTVNSFHSANI